MKCDLLFPTTIFIDDYVLNHTDIIRYAKNRSVYDNSVNKSNIGGYQSENNFFNAKITSDLVKKINNTLNIISDSLKIKSQLFIDGAWVNINSKGHYNAVHIHPRSYLSGVYYLQANKDSGGIMFHTPLTSKAMLDPIFNEEIINVTTNDVIYESKPGRCIIFPAWLYHSTQPNKSDEDRISISFNVFYQLF